MGSKKASTGSLFSSVMIALLFCRKEKNGNRQSERFGNDDRQPDAAYPKQKRQDQHGGNLEYERAQERDRRGYRTVIEGGKEGGAPHVDAHHQKGEGIQPESVAGHLKQPGIVTDEDTHQRAGEDLRQHRENDAGSAHEKQAFFEQVFQLRMVLCAVMVADDGRAADRVAEEDRHKDEVDIHDDTIGRDAVLPRELHQLEVIKDVDDGHRKVRHHL